MGGGYLRWVDFIEQIEAAQIWLLSLVTDHIKVEALFTILSSSSSLYLSHFSTKSSLLWSMSTAFPVTVRTTTAPLLIKISATTIIYFKYEHRIYTNILKVDKSKCIVSKKPNSNNLRIQEFHQFLHRKNFFGSIPLHPHSGYFE